MFFFPLNVKQMNHVAGLLTCFLFGFLPIPNEEQWIKHVRKVLWNLQQWICSGFTPDSLFTTRHESDGWHHNQWQRYILLLKLTFLQILFYPIHIRDVSGPYLLRTFSMQRYLWPKKVRLWYGASHISTHVHRPLSAKQYVYPRNHRAIWSKREAGKLSEPEVRTQYPAWKEIRKEPLHYCTKSH